MFVERTGVMNVLCGLEGVLLFVRGRIDIIISKREIPMIVAKMCVYVRRL